MFDATRDGRRRRAFDELIVGGVNAGRSYALETREERREAVVDREETHPGRGGKNRNADLPGEVRRRHQIEEGIESAGVQGSTRQRRGDDGPRGSVSRER